MTNLSFATVDQPEGLTNGQFTPWVIRWLIPEAATDGFVIQHLQIIFQEIRYCGDDEILSDDSIWNLLDYDGPTRLDYWEAWQYRGGVWQPPGENDGWGFTRVGTFYSSDSEGTVLFKGSAGYYEGDDLNEFGVGWGANGDDQGSPMSGDLMSTVQTPDLPETNLIERAMTVEWRPCNCDSNDNVCRKTTVAIGRADAQVG